MTKSMDWLDLNSVASDPIPGTQRFRHHAMASVFEVFTACDDRGYARQAAWAAFAELDRLELELSRFVETSDIWRINNLGARQPLQLDLDAFECLELCRRVHFETGGAFDITVGSLLDCWRRSGLSGRAPEQDELLGARRRTGLGQVRTDPARHTVELLRGPVMIDLGGFGKGYALDRMAAVLREWDLGSALIHGGYSSVLALGRPPGRAGWPLTFQRPGGHGETLTRVYLTNRAVGGSGLEKGRHIVNPHNGQLVTGTRGAWSSAPTAATADALSTAFMIMTHREIEEYCLRHAESLAVTVRDEDERMVQNGSASQIPPELVLC